MISLERERCDVAIVGAGPAGLAAATTLKALDIGRVVVLERETAPGGVPRHCGHPPFGLKEFGAVMAGPAYARKLAARAQDAGVEVRCRQNVVSLHPGGEMMIAAPNGPYRLKATRILLATGARETPRSARFLSGDRCAGVMNTGALQSFVYLENRIPFRRPVVIGTEMVSYSALLTCRKAGVKPQLMLETADRITARLIFRPASSIFGVPLHTGVSNIRLEGMEKIDAVRFVTKEGKTSRVECDGVILTGGFVPEASLARMGRLHIDAGSGGPSIDQSGRCSDPAYYAAGNLLRPIETAAWCWEEGLRTAKAIAHDIKNAHADPQPSIPITVSEPIKYVTPQCITPDAAAAHQTLQLRLTRPTAGRLTIVSGDEALFSIWLRSRNERRILLPASTIKGAARPIEMFIEEQRTLMAPAHASAPTAERP